VKVSVCIPTYNADEYLRECLVSALSQTCQDIEIIVSDNASTDSTCEIAESFPDPRIRLHRLEKNMGMAFNFNHAGSLAKGDYVKFLCADDILDPLCLAKQVGMLEEAPQAVMVTSCFRTVDASSRTLRTISRLTSRRFLSYAEVVSGSLNYGNLVGPPSAVLIRRSALLKAGPFSKDLPELLDFDLWLRLSALGPVGYLPEPLCGLRIHPQTMTTQLRKAGLMRNDVLYITKTMLRSMAPSSLARRVAWGRVAGSFVNQAFTGLRHGYVRWPFSAFWQAFRIDPGFFGLAMFLALFQTGILGFDSDESRRLRIRRGRTLCFSV
jgi:glycosyltransferase involved in cell wall biosynthesis